MELRDRLVDYDALKSELLRKTIELDTLKAK